MNEIVCTSPSQPKNDAEYLLDIRDYIRWIYKQSTFLQWSFALATQRLPCTIAEFPVTYLGIPLSVAKLPKTTLQPLVDRVADRLPTWKGKLMNKSGRLALIKSTLTAISVHIVICIRLPAWVIKALEKIMKAFLWTGTEVLNAGKCLIAWAQVQRPKDFGVLGVRNLKLSSQSLRLRWLLQQRTEPENLAAQLQDSEHRDFQEFFNASLRFGSQMAVEPCSRRMPGLMDAQSSSWLLISLLQSDRRPLPQGRLPRRLQTVVDG